MTVRIAFQRVDPRDGDIIAFRPEGGPEAHVYGTCDEYTATALLMLKAKEMDEDGNGEFTIGKEVIYPVKIEVTEGIDDYVEEDLNADATYLYKYNPHVGLIRFTPV